MAKGKVSKAKYDELLSKYTTEKSTWEEEKKQLNTNDLQTKINQLENQVKSLQQRDAEWNERHEGNNVYLAKLEKDLSQEKQKVRDLTQQLEIIPTPQSDQSGNEELGKVKESNDLLTSQVSSLLSTIESKNAEIEKLKSELPQNGQNEKTADPSTQSEVISIKQLNVELEQQTKAQQNKIDGLQQRIEELTKASVLHGRQTETKNREIDQLKEDIKQLTDKLNDDSEKQSLKKANDELRDQLNDTISKLHQANTDLMSLKEELNSAKINLKKSDSANSKLKALTQENKILQHTVARMAGIEDAYKSLEETHQNLSKEYESYKQKHPENNNGEANNNPMTVVQEAESALTEQISKLAKEIIDLKEVNTSLTEEISQLKNEVEKNETKIKKLTVENGRLKLNQKNFQSNPEDFENEILGLQNLLKKEKLEKIKLKEDMEKLSKDSNSESIEKLKLLNSQLEEQLVELKTKYQEASNSIANHSIEKEVLNENLLLQQEKYSNAEKLIEKLIQENEAIMNDQHSKKNGSSPTNSSTDSNPHQTITILMKEKKNLCDELYGKTIQIENLIMEKKKLAWEIERIRHEESSFKDTPQKESPMKSPKTSTITIPSHSTLSSPTHYLTENNPPKQANNFEDISLSAPFEITTNLKPNDDLVIPMESDNNEDTTPPSQRGWVSTIWGYFTGNL
eukprot:TRINITY_DN4183_c0_g1_i1.p1 TRINITY_DN4183_c0_g1~~TRINITY_DN4183_c0_g1_i1.p1  ORF type:complete len:684 (+),score=181.53 TRINITY_DN4183_c0_g1_i1:81-2132(+)